jgi:V/A-type H+-transporting ATPase subunit G/H
MENSLQRLLDAELEAEAVVKKALDRREQIMAQSLEEAHMAEARFEARIPELRGAFNDKAEQRIQQTIAEVSLRYVERTRELESMAGESHQDAADAALAILLDPKSH